MDNTAIDNTILDCGHKPSSHDNFTTGYGYDKDHKTHCYECCAKMDIQTMRDKKRIVLYLHDNRVTNWPNSLNLPVLNQRKGKHNIAGSRIDVYFKFDSKFWHGIQYGDNSELCYCKELKNQN